MSVLGSVLETSSLKADQIGTYMVRGYVGNIRNVSTAKPLDEPAAGVSVVLQGLGCASCCFAVEKEGSQRASRGEVSETCDIRCLARI